MPSDHLHTLYARLLTVLDRTAAAVDRGDGPALTALTREHARIMTALRSLGDCREVDMLKIIETINCRLKMLAEKIRRQRDDLCGQLVMSEKKKQAVAVYAKENFRLQPDRHSSYWNGNRAAGKARAAAHPQQRG